MFRGKTSSSDSTSDVRHGVDVLDPFPMVLPFGGGVPVGVPFSAPVGVFNSFVPFEESSIGDVSALSFSLTVVTAKTDASQPTIGLLPQYQSRGLICFPVPVNLLHLLRYRHYVVTRDFCPRALSFFFISLII